jgi:hypothetical protein
MTTDLAKEITTLIPVSTDWPWLFDKLTGLQMTYPSLKQILQAVQDANHWEALVSANVLTMSSLVPLPLLL